MADLTVTLIQTDLYWEDIDANLQMLDQKINSIDEPTEVVILPEMFTTGFSMHPAKLAQPMDGSALRWMKQKAKEKNIILTGSLIIAEEGKYYNRLIWMQPDGRFGQYDKRHLFAYAGEDKQYAAGNKRLIASVNGWKVCLSVCYDLRFPVWTRQSPSLSPMGKESNGEGLYDLLVCVANWPASRDMAWKALLQARAIENQAFVVGVNRVGADGNRIAHNGDSSLVDPRGGIIYQLYGEEDIFTFTLPKQLVEMTRGEFPFLKDADKFRIL